MNSDARRVLSHRDTFGQPDLYQSYYSPRGLWDRFADSAAILTVLVVIATILYRAASQQGRAPPLSSFLWDCLVWAIPSSFLYTIDRWLNPPLFPLPMLQPRPSTYAAKNEILRRVLGVDKPGGLMMSVSQAGRRSLNGLSGVALGGGLKAMADQPPGLGNYDNSCYQNSILQGLASLQPFPSYLSRLPGPNDDRPVVRTVDALRTLIADLNNPSNNGKTIWTPGVLKNMSTWQQQDAQEYFSKLLDEIDKEIAQSAKRLRRPPSFEIDSLATDDTSASQHSDDSGYQSLGSSFKSFPEPLSNRNPLEGLIAQRVACVSCGYCEGLSLIPFNCVTLNLGVNQAEHDLYERLDNYTRVEHINGVQCPKCSLLKVQRLIGQILQKHPDGYQDLRIRLAAIGEALEEDEFDDKTLEDKCNIPPHKRVNSTKTKQTVVARFPRSLAIHVNRSVFDESTGRMFKNLAALRFPRTLDLGPWCLGSADRYTVSENDEAIGATPDRDEEEWLLDPLSSMVAGDQRPSKISGPIYELRAVVTHYGHHENGHYVCYRKHLVPPCETKQEIPDGKPPKLAPEDHDTVSDVSRTEVEGEEVVVEQKEVATDPDDLEFDDDPSSQWWRLSDQDVTKVDEATVLAQGGVFMLFYDCVDPNSVLVSDIDGFVDAQSGSPGSDAGTGGSTENISTPVETDGSESEEPGEREGAARKARAALVRGDVLSEAASVPLPDEDGVI